MDEAEEEVSNSCSSLSSSCSSSMAAARIERDSEYYSTNSSSLGESAPPARTNTAPRWLYTVILRLLLPARVRSVPRRKYKRRKFSLKAFSAQNENLLQRNIPPYGNKLSAYMAPI